MTNSSTGKEVKVVVHKPFGSVLSFLENRREDNPLFIYMKWFLYANDPNETGNN